MVHLYVNVSRVSLAINLNVEPFGQFKDWTHVIDPNFEPVALLVYDNEEMVAINEYKDQTLEEKQTMSLKILTLMVVNMNYHQIHSLI